MGEQAILPKDNMDAENGDEEDSNSQENDEDMETPEEEDLDISQSEMADINSKLDELNSVLDVMETRTNSIYDELLKLLKSNKEVRQQMIQQNTSAKENQATSKE